MTQPFASTPHSPYISFMLRKITYCSAALTLLVLGISLPQPDDASARTPPRSWQATGEGVPLQTALKRFGLEPMIASGELQPMASPQTLAGTGRRVWQQFCGGLPVIGGRVVLRTDGAGHVVWMHSSLARLKAGVSVVFKLGREEAQAAGRISHRNGTSLHSQSALPPRFPGGIMGGRSKEADWEIRPTATRAILPVNGLPVPVWKVIVVTTEPAAEWEVLVDGVNGQVLHVEDRLQRLDARGTVFNPDPKSATGDSTLEDHNDSAEFIPQAAYSQVNLLNVTRDDSGKTILTGLYVDTSPTANRARMDSADFFFNRADRRFEEVMAYYHIDRQARYLIGLGFNDLPPQPQAMNVDGTDEDASWFSPQSGIITTGTGGVDDAEDADVLLHEYGHALIERIIPDWRGGETALLKEGFCDYLAGDYSLLVAPDYHPNQLFQWDGHNQFWPGRVLDSPYHYDDVPGRDPHDAGQLWSATLFEVRRETNDRDNWNRVVLDAIYSLADSATVPDAAQALLASDRALTGGQFHRQITLACEERGILRAGEERPVISHRSLKDSENFNQDRIVVAHITSHFPLDPNGLWLIYQMGDSLPDTARLEADGNDSTKFTGTIPAPGSPGDFSYYLTATDSSGLDSSFPPDAPDSTFHFHVGPDTIPPMIVSFDSLGTSVFRQGDVRISAAVTDNLAVRLVRFEWTEGEWGGGVVDLSPTDDTSGIYVGRFAWASRHNEPISYNIWASDSAQNINIAKSATRSFDFANQMLVDDFEQPSVRWNLSVFTRTDADPFNGGWSLVDRIGGEHAPRGAVAELDETWRLGGFDHASISFAERHVFDRRVGESGFLESSQDSGRTWRVEYRLTGSQQDWIVRDVSLDRWAAQGEPPIRIRFRSSTPAGASPLPGLFIDDVWLRVGNIVSALSDKPTSPLGFIIGEPFPNPTNGAIRFRYQTAQSGEVRLLDIAGRTALALPLPMGERVIGLDAAALPTGEYFVRVQAGERVMIRKVVVVK